MKHISEEIKSIIGKFQEIETIREIWEIGSRDGQDAQALSEVFPLANIHCFEPNPDTFTLVEEVSAKSFGKIKAINLALSDSDGDITFNKIDTSLTITKWLDGNPGASSMFIANPDYEFEKYYQTPIRVKSLQAKTLIAGEDFTVPNLIWMDVQGAEGIVVKGFGQYVSSIDFIYVELSIKPLYLGQPLAAEIVKLLSENFYWYKNLSYGSWQFDALFVNKKRGSRKLWFRNLLLLLSLKSNLKVGIEYSIAGFFRKLIRKLTNCIYRQVTNLFRKNESKILGDSVRSFILRIANIIKIDELPLIIREIISLSQPSNPLKDKALPTIDIAIPCHVKDFENLPLVVHGARASIRNPLGKIFLITPDKLSKELQSQFPCTN